MKVKSGLTDEGIERLRPEDWIQMIQTLQLFAQKLENKDPSKKSFKVSLYNLKISIDQLQKEWDELKIGNGYDYDIFEDDIYQSPYEELEFTLSMDNYDEYQEIVGFSSQDKYKIINSLRFFNEKLLIMSIGLICLFIIIEERFGGRARNRSRSLLNNN